METSPITHALERVQRGDAGASDALWQLVYADLKGIAARRLAKMKPGETLQATALVHEAWMRLRTSEQQGWANRAHFFGAAARSMRNILVDQARRKQRLRRNEGQRPLQLEPDVAIESGSELEQLDILAIDEALDAMGQQFERPTRIIMLRYFTGLSIAEIAEVLGVTKRTVDRDFLFARTWLRRYLDRK